MSRATYFRRLRQASERLADFEHDREPLATQRRLKVLQGPRIQAHELPGNFVRLAANHEEAPVRRWPERRGRRLGSGSRDRLPAGNQADHQSGEQVN